MGAVCLATLVVELEMGGGECTVSRLGGQEGSTYFVLDTVCLYNRVD